MNVPLVGDRTLEALLDAVRVPLVVEWIPAVPAWAIARRILEDLAGEFDDRMVFVRIRLDENPEIAARFGISYPELAVYVAGAAITGAPGWPNAARYRHALVSAAERCRRDA